MILYHNDHLGTPQKLTAANGAVVWSAKYESFGEAVVDAGSIVTNNLRFPGQYYDEETGLHYNYHRYYDPGVGRYLRVDPIGVNAGINMYIYCLNNSINAFDSSGLDQANTYLLMGQLMKDSMTKKTTEPLDPKSKMHTDRNINNICPKEMPDQNCGAFFCEDCYGNKWEKDLGWLWKDYHGHSKGYMTFRGTGKYNGSQCTYDKHGKFIDYGLYMGTYDYGDNLVIHQKLDVSPHEERSRYRPNLTTTY